MIRITSMAGKALWLGTVACVLAAVSAHPRHFPGSHSPFGFAADAATVVGVEESDFSCGELEYGYYADQALDCKVFHICMPNTSPTGRRREAYKFSFFCPNQTRFSQDSRTCIAEEQAYPCSSAHLLYDLNSAFAQPGDGDGEPTSPRTRSSSLSSAAGGSSGLSSAAAGSSGLSSAAGRSSGLTSAAGGSSSLSPGTGGFSGLSSAAGESPGLSSAAGRSSGLSSAAGGYSGLSTAAGRSSGLSSAARGSSGLSSAAGRSSGLASAAGGSSGLSSAAGGSSGLSSVAGAPDRKSTPIPSTGRRQVRPTVSELAFQDRESSDDDTSVIVSLSKDSLASVTSGRFKIDDSRTLDDSSSTAGIDHSHSTSGSSKIDNDNDFILTTQSPSIEGRKTNRLNQNTSKRFKGSHLNNNTRQLSDNANEHIESKQTHRATEQKNNPPGTKGLEKSSNIPRGRKVSGGSGGIVVPGNSLNDEIEEPVAEPEPEPEPSSKTGDEEDAKETGSTPSKSSGVDKEGVLTSNVRSSARLTPFTPVILTPHRNKDANTPLLVGPRPSLSLNAAAISRTQTLPSGQKSTEPFGTPSVGNDLIDGKQSSPDGTVPSFQDHQKPPQNVLGNIRGNFHQIGFQIIEHDQSTDLQGGQNPLVLSPLAKAQKLPASLSLPSLDEPPKREGSRTSQQNLPVSSVSQGRGIPNSNLNNALYSNRHSPVGQTNLGGDVSDATSSGARHPSNRRGNRLYGGDNVTSRNSGSNSVTNQNSGSNSVTNQNSGPNSVSNRNSGSNSVKSRNSGSNSVTSRNSGSNSVTNRNSGANSVTSPNSKPNKLSSGSNRNAYLPQAVSSRDGTSTANVASFQVSDRTATKLYNDGNAGKKAISVNHNNNQNAVPPPPLFESHGGQIKIFEAQPESEEGDKGKISPLQHTTHSPSLSGSSTKSYLPTQESGQPPQTSGLIPGFSAGVRRIKGKLIEGSAVPRTGHATHKLAKTTQKIDHNVSTLSPAAVTSKPAPNNFSPISRTSLQAQTDAPAFSRARGRGRGGTVSQTTVVDASKIDDSVGVVRTEVTSTSLTDSTQQSSAAAGRTNRARNQNASRARVSSQKTTQNLNLQAPSQRPASRNLRARGNQNFLRSSNQLKPKEFETSKGHEVKTTHDLEILLDEDLDAATASLLAGIQPPQKFRHKKDSSSHEAPVAASEEDGEAFVDEPSIQPLVKSPPITGTVIPQRLFNPRQKTPSNRRATPGSVNLGTVGSIATKNINGEINLNLLPTTTTTTTTPRPRTTRLPRSTTERSTTTRRPVNDKRGSVKFTPSPYLDLSWLGPTIRNKITNHFKRVGHSARGRQNSEISNTISAPPTRGESESNLNSINSRKGSDSVGFSLPKSNKISLGKTRQQTTPIPILNSPAPAVAHDLDVAGTTTKAPNLLDFSNRRRTRNHRVKLRVNPVNENAETKENAEASESSITEENRKQKQGVTPRSDSEDQSEPRTLPDEVDVIGGIIPNVKNVRSESNQPSTTTTKPSKNQVGEKPSTVDASTDLSSRKLVPEDQLLSSENVSEGSSKVELIPQTVETTTPKDAQNVAPSDIGEEEKELNIKTTRAQSQSLSRIAGIRKKIKPEGSNPNLNVKTEDTNSELKIKTEDSNSNLKIKTEYSNSDLAENESVNHSTDDVGNLSNTRSRVRNGKRRKVVRLNKRPASDVDGSSTSIDELPENPIAQNEESSTQTSKSKPTRRISQRRTQKNDLKSGVGQANHEDEKSEKLDNVSEPTGAVQTNAENVTKENQTPERKDKILLPVRGTKRQKIPLPTRRESLSGPTDEVTDEISKKDVVKKSRSQNSGRRINSSETDNKNPAQKDTLQDQKPPVISGARSRTPSRTRLTLSKTQETSNSTIPVSSTSERSQNLPTSNVPVVHRLRSRRISTRRRLITSVPTTTAETTVDIKSENTKIIDESGLQKQEESSGPKTAVTGSSTEGTTAPTSKASFSRRKSRTRFTTAIPESVKEVEKIPTEDNAISRAVSTTEITPLSSTSAANNGRRRFRTRINNPALESSKKTETSKSAKKSDTPEFPKKSETPESPKKSDTPESLKKSENSESSKKSETPESSKKSETPESPKNSETSDSLDITTTTSRPTNKAGSAVATPARENRGRFRTRVSAIKPDQLTTSPNSETGDNSLDTSKDIHTNSSPHNGRGFRRTSRRRLISNKISTDDDLNETDEAKVVSERADEREERPSVKADVQKEDGTQNSERTRENDENKTTKLPSVTSNPTTTTTTTTTTTPAPVDFASLFKINTGNRELEDEIQTISESQNTRKTAVRRRKINAVAGAEPKTSKYFGGKNSEKDSLDLEKSSTKSDDEQNTLVTKENVGHNEQISLPRRTTEIEEENSYSATANVGESKETSLQNKILNSGLEIESEVRKATSQPPRRSFARNRRLVKKVKLSKTEVPSESLNNVYETLRSARSNTTVKSNELSIPGLEPGLKLRVVGTSVKKSVSTSSTALSTPEKPESSSQRREGVAISQILDSPHEKPTKTRRKFASRRPVNREVDFSEDLSVPQAAESRAFRRTIIRRKVTNES